MTNKVLLLHGALGSKDQLGRLKEKLSKQYEVYDLDFEGHGGNKSSKDFSIDLFTENVVEFLIEKNLEKVNVFGYSMGGYVALNLARLAPELVSKIMTLGTKFNWTKEIAEKEIRKLNPQKIEEKIPAFANKLAVTHSSNNWKSVVLKTAKMMKDLGAGGKLTLEELKEIPHEVLIGIGGKDEMVSIEESRESASLLAAGRLQIIEGFKHPIERVDTEKLLSIFVAFLKN